MMKKDQVITLPVLRCRHCEYLGQLTGDHRKFTWVPRKAKLPRVCPRCKRFDWNPSEYSERHFYPEAHGERAEVALDKARAKTQRMLDGSDE